MAFSFYCRRMQRMGQRAGFVGVFLAVATAAGCVERRFVVYSDPPGAVVLRNGRPIGATPADDEFVYYGKYKLTLIRDGFETMNVEQPIAAPWYAYPPFDFIAENLLPC